MCNFENGFILCTCALEEENRGPKKRRKHPDIEKKEKSDLPPEYVWRLFRFVKKAEEIEKGKYILPSSDIGAGLNAEWVLLHLNTEDCFDFDYTPQEGDNLMIYKQDQKVPYLSLIFRNKEWLEDHYDIFMDITEQKEAGKVINKES